jgi:hypothetical protein
MAARKMPGSDGEGQPDEEDTRGLETIAYRSSDWPEA